ncbi:neuronal acetylcholine receptor subunit alpha-7-like [Acropora millepora]|uniref:neuronal acetylcholine receptor subunit alpha-7-like n=1 Tax=Acropora millepora TaxID=45264 RepID=UPI001CF49804|nr:neuronal acetylcholine receptor subunit alpha-7-like [Acropora millepora]
MGVVLLVLLAAALSGQVICFHERELVEKLLQNYHKGLRPIPANSSRAKSPTLVNISIKLVQIFEMDVKKQVLITSVWLKQAWFDPALRWNESNHAGIDEVSLSPLKVWVPDTVLLNNADTSRMGKPVGMKNPLLVTSYGTVRWLAPVILKSSCKLDVRYFPFDEQFCRLKFASWTYGSSTMHLKPEETEILQNYTESGEWNLERVYPLTSLSKSTRIRHTESKFAVTYVIHIRRKVFYYFVYLIAPCILTSFMTLIVFTLPPESGERMVVGVTILLSLIVFFLLASTHIPETSEAVPLIGRYYASTIIEITCALVLTCWVLRFHHYNTSVGKVPTWVRVYILGYVAKVVRYKVPDQNRSTAEGIEEEGYGDTAVNDTKESSLARRRLPKEPSGITMMAKRVLRKQEEENTQEEWQLAARVVNRLFLICYLVAVVLSIFGVFLDVPGVLVARPLPPTTGDD